jgi:putative effector of murein hydrolase LrgA (UPF0299 family)
MPNLSLTARRIITGMMSVPLCVCIVNYFGHYRWFWPYDSGVMSISVLIVVIALGWIAPTIEEPREHRDKKDRKAREKMEAYLTGDSRKQRSEKP